jgi:hypothetical protein
MELLNRFPKAPSPVIQHNIGQSHYSMYIIGSGHYSEKSNSPSDAKAHPRNSNSVSTRPAFSTKHIDTTKCPNLAQSRKEMVLGSLMRLPKNL